MNEQMIEYAWKRYKAHKDEEAKEELITHYAHLVKLVAGRIGIYLNHYIDLDDLIGYGVIGLIDAVDKFALDKNVKFETYASLRIRGAILDEVRKLDWMPRSLRKKQKELYKATQDLEHEKGVSPSDDEIANRLGIDLKDYYELVQYSNMSQLLFIDDYSSQVANVADTKNDQPEAYIEKKEMLEELEVAINDLPEREKMVLTLYYYEEMTLKEISHILEVSESRVSQLHTKAVSRLRNVLSKYHQPVPM